jgi:hypothetical protein
MMVVLDLFEKLPLTTQGAYLLVEGGVQVAERAPATSKPLGLKVWRETLHLARRRTILR